MVLDSKGKGNISFNNFHLVGVITVHIMLPLILSYWIFPAFLWSVQDRLASFYWRQLNASNKQPAHGPTVHWDPGLLVLNLYSSLAWCKHPNTIWPTSWPQYNAIQLVGGRNSLITCQHRPGFGSHTVLLDSTDPEEFPIVLFYYQGNYIFSFRNIHVIMELCPPHSYIEVLIPNSSECDEAHEHTHTF